LECLNFFRI